jgi:hypothetical protein
LQVSDVWVREALQIVRKYFRRSIFDPEDEEARTYMMMASSFAGMGFGNAVGFEIFIILNIPYLNLILKGCTSLPWTFISN